MEDLLLLIAFISIVIFAVGCLLLLIQLFHYTFTGRWIP